MINSRWKCEKCGYDVYPGDQICLNCGAKLSLSNIVVPGVDNFSMEESKKKRNGICLIVGTIFSILVIIGLIYFLVKTFVL